MIQSHDFPAGEPSERAVLGPTSTSPVGKGTAMIGADIPTWAAGGPGRSVDCALEAPDIDMGSYHIYEGWYLANVWVVPSHPVHGHKKP